MSNIEGACGVSMQDALSNKDTYGKFGTGIMVKEVDCGVDERVKHGTLRWCRHVMKLNEEGLVKSV